MTAELPFAVVLFKQAWSICSHSPEIYLWIKNLKSWPGTRKIKK